MAIKNKETKKAVNKELDDFLNNVTQEFAENDKLTDLINDFVKKVKKNLIDNDLYASGKLYQSIAPLPFIKRGDITTIKIEAEDYYKDVEDGTKPKGFSKENFKALQPKILEWINAKDSLSAIANTAWRKRAFSYLITRSILRKGTIKRFGYKGKRFLTDEIPTLEKDLIKLFEEQWQ